jgi:CHAT domain-containing protein/tetratricopeptide (TPR) repeat protein
MTSFRLTTTAFLSLLLLSGSWPESSQAFAAPVEAEAQKAKPGAGLDAAKISAKARDLANAGQIDAAEKLLRFAIALRMKTGSIETPGTADDFLLLSDLLRRRTALNDAEAILTFLTEKLEAAKGKPSPLLAEAYGRLGTLYGEQGRAFKARLILMKAVSWAKELTGPNSPATADALLQLATAETRALQFESARKGLDEALEILNNAKGQDPVRLARAKQQMGELYFTQRRVIDSLKWYSEARDLRERTLGPKHLETAQSLVGLSSANKLLGKLEESEDVQLRAIAIYEGALGVDHPYVATALNNLGQLYYIQGRYEEAESVLKRSISIKETKLGANHPSIADSANHLGYMYYRTGRLEEAARSFNRAFGIWSAAATAQPRYAANAQGWIGAIKREKGDLDGAEKDLTSAIQALEKTLGSETVAAGDAYHQLGKLRQAQKRYDDAEKAMKTGIKRMVLMGGDEHVASIEMRNSLAKLQAEAGRLDDALETARLATEGLRDHVRHSSGERSKSLASELRLLREAVITHVGLIGEKLKGLDPDSSKARGLVRESFAVGQIARSTSAAQALAKMAARFSAGDGELAKLVRDRQDMSEKWAEADNLLASAFLRPESQRDLKIEAGLREIADGLRAKISELDERIRTDYPSYAELAAGPPLALDDAQQLLGASETALVYLIGETKSFLWAISPKSAMLKQIDVGAAALDRSVRRLRHSLAPQGIRSLEAIRPVPVRQAYNLYRDFVQPGESLMAAQNHLIVIPDGGLQSLPMSVLVTSPDAPVPSDLASHADVPWLGAQYAISVLPSAGSLRALRKLAASAGRSAQPFIGIGDPRLSTPLPAQASSLRAAPVAPAAAEQNSLAGWRAMAQGSRGSVNPQMLSSMPELPETADELKRIAATLGAGSDDLVLRDQATEANVRARPLDRFQVVQFATHGLMAGDFQGLFEPALVLTPPRNPQPANDGLLTASEISQLKLNADWVVLSACNTAAPDGTPGAEGLSGLAKAFFFAGSRSMLVSHWEVMSEAAVALTSGIFAEAKKDTSLGRAEALRRSLVNLIKDKQHPQFAHPMFWAPFVLVGEGGRN